MIIKSKNIIIINERQGDKKMVAKCMKCGKVFNVDGTVLKPIGDGGYLECCPKCGSTNVYYTDCFSSEEENSWRDD
ncbi:hypothetical protein [Sporomusa malonica]|uniref:Uncharacterized protein n=1 Tax=Sporomusa malonica TaxID=112901 RepID=A0A1W2BGU0_9FIRM|nr:hypothetical protein [Sporomusa malonica]SMC72215.1 hypothetical protein SAMN04488500_107176 [Sporomusa malonica]